MRPSRPEAPVLPPGESGKFGRWIREIETVEVKDTRLYYTRLQPEERAVVAGIVRAIMGSEELGLWGLGAWFSVPARSVWFC